MFGTGFGILMDDFRHNLRVRKNTQKGRKSDGLQCFNSYSGFHDFLNLLNDSLWLKL